MQVGLRKWLRVLLCGTYGLYRRPESGTLELTLENFNTLNTKPLKSRDPLAASRTLL